MLNNVSNQVELNNANFFIDNNPNGYMTKESFLQYTEKFGPIDRKHFGEALYYSKTNNKIDNISDIKYNPLRKDYVVWFHISFDYPTEPLKRRLLHHPEIIRFLIDCQNGLKHTFDLWGLEIEAKENSCPEICSKTDSDSSKLGTSYGNEYTELEGDIDLDSIQIIKITNISSDVLVDNYEEPFIEDIQVDNYEEPFIEDIQLEGYIDPADFKNMTVRDVSLDDPIWLDINMDDFNNY